MPYPEGIQRASITLFTPSGDPIEVVDDGTGTFRLGCESKAMPIATRIEEWLATPIALSSSAFTDVYIKAGHIIIYQAVFRLKSSKASMKVVADGVEIVPALDLESIEKDLKLGSEELHGFPLAEYEDRRWVFRPAVPLEISTDFKIQIKADQNGKKVERGLTVWGQL